MNTRSLREILLEKTKYYLAIDNPDPKTQSIPMQIFSFFMGRGQAGRVRANRYKKELENTEMSDEFLLKKVWAQVQSDNSQGLGTSKQFRLRLLQGVCDFLKISSRQRDEAERLTYQRMASMSHQGGGVLSSNYCRTQVMRQLIWNKMRENKLRNENTRLLKFGGDQSL